MEGVSLVPTQSVGTILCCECGLQIPPNPTAMCINCIRSKIDIGEHIPKQFCRSCERYLSPPSAWMKCELESRELLALCLKRLKGLNKVRLVDAGFVWTEPHSKRLKVKLTIQQEVYTGAVLQQIFVVEYVVANQMCDQCHRREAKDTWNAVVQARQKVRHKKTFLHLEQLIIKHHQHTKTVSIKANADGIDFFFDSRADARHFAEFLGAVAPTRCKTSERLISHDVRSNTFNFKYTFAVEIVPVCKDDLVCLSPAVARNHGCMGQIGLCVNVGSSIHVLDFNTLQVGEILATSYWADPFYAVASAAQLIELTVIDIEPVRDDAGRPIATRKVLVKKSYRDKRKHRKRNWKLQTLAKDEGDFGPSKREEEAAQRDYESFLQDLEEDKELRSTVNIYKDPSAPAPAAAAAEEQDPELAVGLDEMLDELAAMELQDEE